MNYRNNPGPGNQRYGMPHGSHRQQGPFPPSKSFGAKSGGFPGANSGGFHIGGELPTMPPAGPMYGQELLPAVHPNSTEVSELTSAPSKGGGFSLANLSELKGLVDRMGGLDGILSTVTKVQKVMSSVSQMAPLVKVLLGSFGKKSKADSDDDSESIEWKPKRRRKRRKTGKGGGGKRPVKRRR
ncbi:hypothetical protein [Paenibacillus arenilitoris]|uniref:Tyrosine protein kinase n=1 Tax=Paenibacillus arenilitoris TaxID=2772299 RepID=A0A927CLT3_9BACL|nr:hypothetical protein [Paenibacillus arenilitoris]MBD2868943.1 hypothetical protein [Paenibacillus arenilitoris]